MKENTLFILVFMLCIITVSSQNSKENFLQSKTFDSLMIMYDMYARDTITIKKIAKSFIEKAKNDNDSIKVTSGYTRLASVSKRYLAIKLLDTAIAFSKNSESENFPSTAYLKQSQYLFDNEEYEKSLKKAIQGYQSANNKKNIDQQITALHHISKVNELWGDYKKALDTELLAYRLTFSNKDTTFFLENYLLSLEGIGKCYVRLKKPDSALIYFNKGITESLKKKDTTTYLAFVSRTAMALFEKGQFQNALDSLQKGDTYREKYNNRYISYYYYYAGNCYYNLGNKEKGVSYFYKLDSIYEKRHVLNPELPLVYDKLITFNKSKNNTIKELDYLYKLVRVNRIIDVKKIYIKDKTENDFFIPKLLEDKEEIIADLNKKNKSSLILTWWILGFIFLLVLILVYYINRQQKFKKRFNNLISQQQTVKNKEVKLTEVNNGISINTIKSILEHLDVFEKEKKYLSQEVSMHQMAKNFETNSTYLSKVINLKKDKIFLNILMI